MFEIAAAYQRLTQKRNATTQKATNLTNSITRSKYMQIVVKPFPFLNFNDLNFVRKERSKFQNALKQGQIHTISKLILSFPKKKK